MSDSHGKTGAVSDIVDSNLGKAQMFIHLGDGENETDYIMAEYPHIDMRRVAGNCDYCSTLPLSTVIDVDGARIFAAHGHSYGVKGGLEHITAAAKQNDCSIVLFGHTHERFLHYENGIYYMNPGSCAQPRDGKNPSYGYIDITESGIFTAIVDLKYSWEK